MSPQSPYQGYSYAYPHKSAYRPLDPPVPLGPLWEAEDRTALFGYVHIPFCEMRCGFCNLFTVSRPPAEVADRYVDRLVVNLRTLAGLLGDTSYARLAIGGGTPTLLSASQLATVLDAMAAIGADPATVPMSVETSPATATPERLRVLAERGTTRISIGIQTFDRSESRRLARPQDPAEVEAALVAIADAGIAETNLDLIYGIDGQTPASFVSSIDRALDHAPTELYLYPLYVRPLTGLDRSRRAWDDQRLLLYQVGRDHLAEAGYRQVSMRCFRRGGSCSGPDDVTDYTCQEDGMVGFGVGARSYTAGLHYSSDYAVSRSETLGVVEHYLASDSATTDTVATNGITLDQDEQARRHLVKSLLRTDGLDVDRFTARFGRTPDDTEPLLARFREQGWLLDRLDATGAPTIVPTAEGLARSDQMGPLLASERIRALSREYVLR